MKHFWQTLIQTLRPASAGLFCGCLFSGLVLGMFVTPPTSLDKFAIALSIGLFAIPMSLIFGIIPTYLYGAPLYAFAHYKNSASYLIALTIGLLPGPIVWIIEPERAGVFLLFSVPVSLCTHYFAKKRVIQSGL